MIEKRGPQCAQLTKGYCKRCACVFRSRKHSGQTAISGATCVTSSDSDRLGVNTKTHIWIPNFYPFRNGYPMYGSHLRMFATYAFDEEFPLHGE